MKQEASSQQKGVFHLYQMEMGTSYIPAKRHGRAYAEGANQKEGNRISAIVVKDQQLGHNYCVHAFGMGRGRSY
jgi:hypothetical protein